MASSFTLHLIFLFIKDVKWKSRKEKNHPKECFLFVLIIKPLKHAGIRCDVYKNIDYAFKGAREHFFPFDDWVFFSVSAHHKSGGINQGKKGKKQQKIRKGKKTLKEFPNGAFMSYKGKLRAENQSEFLEPFLGKPLSFISIKRIKFSGTVSQKRSREWNVWIHTSGSTKR